MPWVNSGGKWTDNTMTKLGQMSNIQYTIGLKIEKKEPHLKPDVNSDASKTYVILLHSDTRRVNLITNRVIIHE